MCPYICNNGKFPVGHPTVYVGADCPPECLPREGIIKCRVLPPRKLYHPVLPYKSNSKLMFPLCYTCTDTKKQRNCRHWWGAMHSWNMGGGWVPQSHRDELWLVDVFEFWEHKMTCYDKDTNTEALFAQYVNMITVQREFRERFRNDAPCRNNITRWYRQFVETGCLCKGTSPVA